MTVLALLIGFALGYGFRAFLHFYRAFIRQLARATAQAVAFEAIALGSDGFAEKMEQEAVKRAIKELIDESK